MENHELLDEAAGLIHMGGDQKLYRQILQIFFEDAPGQIKKIQTGIESHDVNQIERESHGLKGAAANVGAESIRKAALEVELAAKAGDFEKIRTRFEQLENEWTRFKAFLKNLPQKIQG
ncbi:MAG: Hpt domain-containing protein [Candidatus Omnitrophica bacterium]|nr:Hpt domain-containing protein [Candidatus Omnitrophota bacterium]